MLSQSSAFKNRYIKDLLNKINLLKDKLPRESIISNSKEEPSSMISDNIPNNVIEIIEIIESRENNKEGD